MYSVLGQLLNVLHAFCLLLREHVEKTLPGLVCGHDAMAQ